jgi:hypothetical protein
VNPRNTTGYWVYIDGDLYAPGSFIPRGATSFTVWDMYTVPANQLRFGENPDVELTVTVPVGATMESIRELLSEQFHQYMTSPRRTGYSVSGPSGPF